MKYLHDSSRTDADDFLPRYTGKVVRVSAQIKRIEVKVPSGYWSVRRGTRAEYSNDLP